MSSKAKRNFIANPGVIWVFLQLSWASCITFIMMWEQLCSAVEQYTQHLPQMIQCPLSSPHTYMESFASVLLEAKIQLCIYSEEFQVWRNAYPAPPEANASPHANWHPGRVLHIAQMSLATMSNPLYGVLIHELHVVIQLFYTQATKNIKGLSAFIWSYRKFTE